MRLYWKLFLALWLSIMGFTVLMGWINEAVVHRSLGEITEARLSSQANQLERFLSLAARESGRDGMLRVLRGLPRGTRRHVFILDDNGEELGGRLDQLNRIGRQGGTLLRRPLEDLQGRHYTLVVAQRVPTRALLRPGPRGLGLRLLVAALISALVSGLLARMLAAPLEALGRASRKLARGDLGARVGPEVGGRRDEFGWLATDFNQMAERLEEMQSANRRLLRDVSHELRSPLARLRVALGLARQRGDGALAAELDRIELETTRLQGLVDEVLALLREASDTQPPERSDLDLVALLGELVEVVGYESPPDGAGIRMDAPRSLHVLGNAELLRRTFENLLRNAITHTNPARGVEVEVRSEDDGARVRVRDYGPGVPDSALQRIFEPFYRVQEARERDSGRESSGGHGLGLAIARAAVRRHGGTIRAEPARGGGLVIDVFLPSDGA